MATGIVLKVVEKLYAALHSEELREVWSMLGYESQLDDLSLTISTIKSVLLDAESKHQDLSHEGRHYVDRLKEAVYDVDDLLDEFNTIVQREKLKKGGKIFKKVRQFFSRSNYFRTAFNMSVEIKKLTEKLDKIAKDHRQFGLSDVHVPRRRRDATFSYTTDHYIIGREVDKESIVAMLLGESNSTNDVGGNVSFVSIIGMGGLGKTALAQLVYNENRIENTFDLRLWVYVSEDFTLANIFSQILRKNVLQIEELQREFRNLVEGKKYLLVLDDVWSESRDEWDKLKVFLDVGKKGSRILVTSRSRKVAKVLEDDLMYELKGLSEEDSWDLFKKFAFRKGQEPMNNGDYLFDIGKEVSKKCANIPLALRVVGSMLYEQDESKWLWVLQSANLGQGEEGILPILKFSYYELSSALKSCFSYCVFFPKGHVMEKERLIRLWLVHGCLDQTHDCRSAEDVGEEYFSILLSRCFLQDITMDEYGEIKDCKMHDLIHDLAQEVVAQETVTLGYCSAGQYDLAQEVAAHETVTLDHRSAGQLDRRNRHLSLTLSGSGLLSEIRWSKMKKLRTIIHGFGSNIFYLADIPLNVTAICFHLKRLRVLDLSHCDLITLPNKVGNLSHLRYLDLSYNRRLTVLPNSITKLYNLQVLNLNRTGVRDLPLNMKKLVNLVHLPCDEVFMLATGLDNLTWLRTLSCFLVRDGNSGRKLRDLKALVNLRGELRIKFSYKSKCDVANYQDVELIRVMQLKKLRIDFKQEEAIPETLLGSLQPHHKLKGFEIRYYNGLRLPNWVNSLTTSLPNLVSIFFAYFDKLVSLPSVSQLPHLKSFKLHDMPNMEFIECHSDDKLPFFPSLEVLELRSCPKLKGWWREEISRVTGEAGSSFAVVPPFPSLRELHVRNCPSLTALPSCPKLCYLCLEKCHEALTLVENKRVVPSHPTTGCACSSSCLSSSNPLLYLNKVEMDNIGMLDSFFGESLRGIHRLFIGTIDGDSLSTIVEKCVLVSTIKMVTIRHASNGIGRYYFPIKRTQNMALEKNEGPTMTSLESLELCSLPNLVNLPNVLQYSTTLQSMKIGSCKNLEELPEWINCLTSLQKLVIGYCEKLKSLPEAIGHMPTLQTLSIIGCTYLIRRCRQPDGEDWHKIRHIPNLELSEC